MDDQTLIGKADVMPVDLSIFKSAVVYRHFNETDWKVLAELLKEAKLAHGEVLFREGEAGDGFYLVRSGKIRIRRMVNPEEKKQAHEQLLTILSAGQLLGEMALVDGASRSADAMAAEDTVLYHMTQADYEDLKTRHPGTALRIQDLVVGTLCWRLREANRNFEIIQFWVT
jgi:CRP/FNR family transcriptional regulator, cyclic AMP receptor protein